MKMSKIKSAIGQLIDGYLELHRTGYGMVNVNTILEDLENLAVIIDSEEDNSWALSKDGFTPKDVFRFNLASCLYNYGKEVAAKCLDTHILDEELNYYVTEADVNKAVERNIELLRRNAGEYEKMKKEE